MKAEDEDKPLTLNHSTLPPSLGPSPLHGRAAPLVPWLQQLLGSPGFRSCSPGWVWILSPAGSERLFIPPFLRVFVWSLPQVFPVLWFSLLPGYATVFKPEWSIYLNISKHIPVIPCDFWGSEWSRMLSGLGQRHKRLNCNSVLSSRPSQAGLVGAGYSGIPELCGAGHWVSHRAAVTPPATAPRCLHTRFSMRSRETKLY